MLDVGCTIMSLHPAQHEAAARQAVDIDPRNAFCRPTPQRIGVLKTAYWGLTPLVIPVSFMEPIDAGLAGRILSHMNAWHDEAGICHRFALTGGTGDVRITREGSGYWSYLGTDIKQVDSGQPTFCLQAWTDSMPESEFRRVIRHEAGHTLGFPHEHLRAELVAGIDPMRAYQYFMATQGWDPATTRANVLTPIDPSLIEGSPVDVNSIMCYQLPGSITRDGRPIPGGADINANDAAFARLIYPQDWFADVAPLAMGAASHDLHHMASA